MPTPFPIIEFPPSPTRPAIEPPEEMTIDPETTAPRDLEEPIPSREADTVILSDEIADPRTEPDTTPPPLVRDFPTNEDGGHRPSAS